MDAVANIELDRLVAPHVALRLVDKDSIEYLNLRDSIDRDGLLTALPVREITGGRYEVIDGWNRFECCKDLNRSPVPCIIKTGVDPAKFLVLQLEANAHQRPTQPVDYAKRLHLLLELAPEASEMSLAKLVNKPASWVREMLGLLSLLPDIQSAVDRGELKLKNALALARLPQSLQKAHYEKARSSTIKDFKAHIDALVRSFTRDVFDPVRATGHLRTVRAVLRELENFDVGPWMIGQTDGSPRAVWDAALRWVVNLDPETVKATEERLNAKRPKSLRHLLSPHDSE